MRLLNFFTKGFFFLLSFIIAFVLVSVYIPLAVISGFALYLIAVVIDFLASLGAYFFNYKYQNNSVIDYFITLIEEKFVPVPDYILNFPLYYIGRKEPDEKLNITVEGIIKYIIILIVPATIFSFAIVWGTSFGITYYNAHIQSKRNTSNIPHIEKAPPQNNNIQSKISPPPTIQTKTEKKAHTTTPKVIKEQGQVVIWNSDYLVPVRVYVDKTFTGEIKDRHLLKTCDSKDAIVKKLPVGNHLIEAKIYTSKWETVFKKNISLKKGKCLQIPIVSKSRNFGEWPE